MPKMFSFRVPHSPPTIQPAQNRTASIALQFAAIQLLPTPILQPTPSMRDATSPSDHVIATIEEVIHPRGDPPEPNNQGMVSSSSLYSTLFSRQNFRRQEGAHQKSRKKQHSRDVVNLSSWQNSQCQNVATQISHHPSGQEPVLLPLPLPGGTYTQSKSTTKTSDPLTRKEICAPVRGSMILLLLQIFIITPNSIQPISPINLTKQTSHNYLSTLRRHPFPPSPSSIQVTTSTNKSSISKRSWNNNQRKDRGPQWANRSTTLKSPASNYSTGSGRRSISSHIRSQSSISPTSFVQWSRRCVRCSTILSSRRRG